MGHTSIRGVVGSEKGVTSSTNKKNPRMTILSQRPSKTTVEYFMSEEKPLECISWKDNDILFNYIHFLFIHTQILMLLLPNKHLFEHQNTCTYRDEGF